MIGDVQCLHAGDDLHCQCMRLATCLCCRTITKLSDFEGTNPDHDVVLQDWIDRHLHGVPVDEIPGPLHPGANIAVVDMPDITRSPKFFSMPIEDQERALERIEGEAVISLQSELMRTTQQVFEYRDDLRDEAAKCYLRHHSPSYPERGVHRLSGRLQAGRADQGAEEAAEVPLPLLSVHLDDHGRDAAAQGDVRQ